MKVKILKSKFAPWDVKRELIVRKEVETNLKYGCPPNQRPIQQHIRYGFINLDKPKGPSSHEVTAWVKRILNIPHAGHGGTLETLIWLGRSRRDRSFTCST